MKDNVINIQKYSSPCGELLLGTFNYKLCLCEWAREADLDATGRRVRGYLKACYEEHTDSTIDAARKQLDEYFAGRRRGFDLPLLHLGTEFQQRVWRELSRIPYGETISYGEEARRLGCPNAVRAVANANHANAISIIVPCHRVIGSDNRLVGYGGGIEVKKFLLVHEKSYSEPSFGLFAP